MDDGLDVKPNRKRMWIFLATIAVLGAAAGGFFFFRSRLEYDVVAEVKAATSCQFSVYITVGRGREVITFDREATYSHSWKSKTYKLKYDDNFTAVYTGWAECNWLECSFVVDGERTKSKRSESTHTPQVSCEIDLGD